jgi:hypothetical protein
VELIFVIRGTILLKKETNNNTREQTIIPGTKKEELETKICGTNKRNKSF